MSSDVQRGFVAAILLFLTVAVVPVVPVGGWASGSNADGACPTLASPGAGLAALSGEYERAPATRLVYPQPAATSLRQLADRITTSPCDSVPGRFDLIHYRTWTGPPMERDARLWEIVRWRADDGSGAELSTGRVVGFKPVFKNWWWPDLGRLPHVVNPFLTAETLSYEVGSSNAPATCDADPLYMTALLATAYTPRREARAALLAILARYGPLVYYPRAVDRNGRLGVAVAAIGEDGYRQLLTLHPTTGELLSYEAARPTPSNGWQVVVYRLFLSHRRSAERWWEPSPNPTSRVASRLQHPRLGRVWERPSTPRSECPPL